MSHTNSTTNYSLPQFVGTDKPAWLTDINGAFSAIDTNLKSVSDTATTAGATATTASTNIGTLSELTTTNKTNLVSAINENVTNIGTVSSVASQASTNASNAITGLQALQAYLNFTQTGSVTATIANGSFDWQSFEQAVNADGSLGKIYGSARAKRTSSGSQITISIATAFRPEQTISINGICWYQESQSSTSGYGALTGVTFSIATDGTLTATLPTPYNYYGRIYFFASVIFAKNFGDSPVNPE